jgi:four helix bundle protein
MSIQRFQDLTLEIYKLVRSFPEEERFCLSIQMRRAAISIGANIAEGFGRVSAKEQRRFFSIARGSAEELKYFAVLAHDLGYLNSSGLLQTPLDEVCAMLYRPIFPKA